MLSDTQRLTVDNATVENLASPKNLSYHLLFISKDAVDDEGFCGGKIASNIMDCFCARVNCNIKAHKVKHPAFEPNTMYIGARSGGTGQGAVAKVMYPEQYSYRVYDTKVDLQFMDPIAEEYMGLMQVCKDINAAARVFNEFVAAVSKAKLEEGPWREAIRKSEVDMDFDDDYDSKLGRNDLEGENTKHLSSSVRLGRILMIVM